MSKMTQKGIGGKNCKGQSSSLGAGNKIVTMVVTRRHVQQLIRKIN